MTILMFNSVNIAYQSHKCRPEFSLNILRFLFILLIDQTQLKTASKVEAVIKYAPDLILWQVKTSHPVTGASILFLISQEGTQLSSLASHFCCHRTFRPCSYKEKRSTLSQVQMLKISQLVFSTFFREYTVSNVLYHFGQQPKSQNSCF